MKYLFFYFLSIPALLSMTGCTGSSETETTDNTPVTVNFNLWQAAVARAGETSQNLAKNATFRVYAYKAGTAVTEPHAGSSIYTVQDSKGSATGSLSLNRGTYDFYFVSNNTGTTPPAATGGMVTVSNGNDFMYTTLREVAVQPSSAGDKTVDITVHTPFTRLGSQVKMKVKPNNSQPVPLLGLEVNYIKLKQLSTSRSYTLGTSNWSASSIPGFTQELIYNSSEFTRAQTGSGFLEPWISSPKVVLPIDASKDLVFEVSLKVSYGTIEHIEKTDFIYTPTIRKALLAGMTYEFEFTLKFYGVITPVDLTLAIREYNTVNINTDNIGGDEE